MTFDWKKVSVTFDQSQEPEQGTIASASFDGRVQRASAAIAGFDIRFSNSEQPIFREKLTVDIVSISGTGVTAVVHYRLNDSEKQVVDPYEGSVDVLFLAEYD